MKKVYDFSKGKRGAVIPTTGKTRITIYLDDATLKRFKTESGRSGKGYQTLINEELKHSLQRESLERTIRKVVRDELKKRPA